MFSKVPVNHYSISFWTKIMKIILNLEEMQKVDPMCFLKPVGADI